MPLINAKCTNCGAILKVDNSKDATICEHCGSAFIVEKAIHQYMISNYISADTVIVQNEPQKDFIIRAGVLEKYVGESVNVTIPGNVKQISERCFQNMKYIRSVHFHTGLEVIGKYAFSGCTGIQALEFPENISISEGAFSHCTSLQSIVFRKGTHIDPGAFYGCIELNKVDFCGSVSFNIRVLHYDEVYGEIYPYIWETDYGCPFEKCSSLNKISNIGDLDLRIFKGTKWYDNIITERKAANLCLYCGAHFKGVFKKVCIRCNKPKDY